MDSAGTAWNDLGLGWFGLADALDALADWFSGDRIEAVADASFDASDQSWIVDNGPALIEDFLSLDGDAFLFGSDAPTPDAGRVPATPAIPSFPAADSPLGSLLANADDGDDGPFADLPGFDFLPADGSGDDGGAGDPALAATVANGPDPEGIDTGSPVAPTPLPSLSDLPTDTPGAVDPDLPGTVPDTIPTDDGGVVDVAGLDDSFDFLL